MEFDPLYVITIVSLGVTAAVGFFSIKNQLKKDREESHKQLVNLINESGADVKSAINEKLTGINTRFERVERGHDENKEDIEDVENDMKQMTIDFKMVCDKMSKFDYVIHEVIPDFKILQKDFYNFKAKVESYYETNSKKKNELINNYKGSGLGNVDNINGGNIRE